MAFEIFKLFGSIYVDNSAANSEFDKTVQKADETAKKFGDVSSKAEGISKVTGAVGSALTKYVTVPLTVVGTAAVSAFNEVDDGMDVVIEKTGATGKTAEELEAVYRSVGKTVPASFDDIGSAVGEVNTRFGFTNEELETASTKFLEFSKITGVDTTEGVRLVSRAMNDAGIDASEYSTVLDELSKASQASGIDVSTLTENLSKYGASMRNLGFDTEESIALFSTWESAGVNTEIAFSGMKKAISNWSKEGKNANEEFGKTLESIQSAPDITTATQEAIETFGQKAGPDLADAIYNGRFNYEEFMQIIGDSQGTLDDTYNEMLDGGDRIKTAWNNIKIAGADLGESILNVVAPAIERIASAVETAGQWFSSLSPQMQQFIVILGMIAAAAGPVILGFSGILKKIAEFSGYFKAGGILEGIGPKLLALSGPIAIVIASIAAVSAILIGAWKNSEKFRDAVTGAWTRIQQGAQQCFTKIQTALAPVQQTFQDLWTQVQPVLQQIGDLLATYVVPIIETVVAFVLTSITNIISGMAPLFSAVGNILSVIVNLVGMVVALINGDWNGAMEFGKQALQSLWDAVVNVWNGIWGTISALLSVIGNGISAAWNAIVSTAQTMLSNLWNAFSTGFSNLWNSVSGWATTVVTNISSALSGLWQIGSDALQNFSDGIKSGFESLWTNITSWCGTVVDNFKSALGIASPSKILEAIGKFVTEGFFNGMSSEDWGAFAGNIMNKVVEAFQNGGATLSTLVSKLGSGITSILKNMGIDLTSLFGGGGNVASLGGLLWPSDTSTITSWFGYRDDTGGVGSSYHQGLDIGASYGTPIYAAADGAVELAGEYGGYGNAVKLNNGGGLETLYGHMSSVAVSSGQVVTKGQVIGYVGSTGNSTGPHLHFSVLVDGEQVDPSQFFGLAKGGIVTEPIWTKLGEAGESEAVVPLSKAGSMGFGGITKEDLIDAIRIVVNERDQTPQEINLTAKVEMDKREVGKLTATSVEEENTFLNTRINRMKGVTV